MMGNKLYLGLLFIVIGIALIYPFQVFAVLLTKPSGLMITNSIVAFLVCTFLIYHGLKKVFFSQRSRAPKSNHPWLYLYDFGLFCFACVLPSVVIIPSTLGEVARRHAVPDWISGLGGLSVSGFFPLGLFFLLLSYRVTQPSAAQLIRQKKKKPIVYLRAFKDDKLKFAALKRLKGDPIWRVMLSEGLRLERVLNHALSPYGPFVALGSPREKIPKEGAARDTVLSNWKEHLTRYLQNSRILVVLVGESKNLAWEIDWIIQNNRISDLLLILPPKSKNVQKRWQSFLSQTDLGKKVALPHLEEITERTFILFQDGKIPQAKIYQIIGRKTEDYIETLRTAVEEHFSNYSDPFGEVTAEDYNSLKSNSSQEISYNISKVQPKYKLFNVTQIIISSIISPIAALLQMAHNTRKCKYSITVIVLIAIFYMLSILVVQLSLGLDGAIPLMRILNIIITLGLWVYARWRYDFTFEAHVNSGGKFHSYFMMILITLIAFIITCLYQILIVLLVWLF